MELVNMILIDILIAVIGWIIWTQYYQNTQVQHLKNINNFLVMNGWESIKKETTQGTFFGWRKNDAVIAAVAVVNLKYWEFLSIYESLYRE